MCHCYKICWSVPADRWCSAKVAYGPHPQLLTLGDIVLCDFHNVIVSSSTVISICNAGNLAEISLKGTKVVLWCVMAWIPRVEAVLHKVYKDMPKTQETDDEGDDLHVCSRSQRRNKNISTRGERRKDTKHRLETERNAWYFVYWIWIWGEIYSWGGIHSSLESAPISSMFVRVGKCGACRKKDQVSSATEALTQAAVAVSSAFSPRFQANRQLNNLNQL